MVDPMGDSAGIRMTPDGKPSRFQNVIIFGGPNGDIPISDADGAKVARLIAAQPISFVIDLSEMVQAGQLRFMTQFADILYEDIKIPIFLMIDEAHIFAPQQRGDGGASAMLLNRITRLQSAGRKRGIFLWLMTQRPARINKNAIAGTETLIVLKMTLKNDITAIEDWLANHDEGEADMVRKNLTKLEIGEGFAWVPFANFLKRIQFPLHTTMDTGKTPGHGDQVGGAVIKKIDVSAIAAAFGQALTGDPKDDEIAQLSKALADHRMRLADMRETNRKQSADLAAVTNRETKLLLILSALQIRIGAAIGSPQIIPLHIDEPFEKYLFVEDTEGRMAPLPREGDNARTVPAARRRMRAATKGETK
jgi:hypothetical protein